MKKFLSTLGGLLLLGLVNQAGAVTLSLTPASQTAANNDTVFLDLVVSGLGNFAPDSLGDFDVDIGYDTAVLSFQSYSLGALLGDVGLGEALDVSLGDTFGSVNIAELSLLEPDLATCFFCVPPFLDDLQPDSFILATLTFLVDALAPGSSTVVSIDTVYAVGDGFGSALTLDGTSGAVINAVPVPAAVWLFGSGLIGLIGIARRKSA